MSLEKIILITVAVFCLVAAVTNWDWFFNNPRAAFIARIFKGRNGARIFYLLVGIILLYIGLFLSST